MRIIVLVKEDSCGNLDNDFKINTYDLYALKKTLRLKELTDAEIICVSMGPETTSQLLFRCNAMGVDESYHLIDTTFAGSDTYATSYILSKAIEKLMPVDIIVCGAKSTAGETGNVGPEVAAWLNIPFYTNVTDICMYGSDIFITKEDSNKLIQFTMEKHMTFLACFKHRENSYSSPSLYAIKKAHSKLLQCWNASDLEVDLSNCGTTGSKTVVKRSKHVNCERKKNIIHSNDTNAINILVRHIEALL